MITVALDCLNSLFQCGNEMHEKTDSASNLYCDDFKKLGGIEKLGNLTQHSKKYAHDLAF